MINAMVQGVSIVFILLTVVYLLSAISPGFVAIQTGLLLALGAYTLTYF